MPGLMPQSEWSEGLPQPLPPQGGPGPGRQEGGLQCPSWAFHEVPVRLLSGPDVYCDGARTSGRNFVEHQGLWV